jgi:hypothetical protein
LKFLSESGCRHVDSKLVVKVLSKSKDFTFLGEKNSKLITNFAIDERSLFFHEIFVYFFWNIDVMLSEFTPNEKFIVFRDGSGA